MDAQNLLKKELTEVGLNITEFDNLCGMWMGKIKGKPFEMICDSEDQKRGNRRWLTVYLPIQHENSVIEAFNKFMGYHCFCRYQEKEDDDEIRYQWNRNHPERSLECLAKENLFRFVQFEEGLKPQKPTMDMLKRYKERYIEFTPESVAEWGEALKENPDVEWNYNKLSGIFPFVKLIMPRIAKNQSLFGLSIISLDKIYPEEEGIIRYGLEPLVKEGILEEMETNKIVNWFKQTTPTWDSNNNQRFEKIFIVGPNKYKLLTDCYRGCRDLNLRVVVNNLVPTNPSDFFIAYNPTIFPL